jgi:hypothetical protein
MKMMEIYLDDKEVGDVKVEGLKTQLITNYQTTS